MKEINEITTLNEMKEEAKKSFAELEQALQEDLLEIASLTEDNVEELILAIFENAQELAAIESYILLANNSLNTMYESKKELTYKKELTSKDIIRENFNKIMGIYNGSLLAILLTSSNPIEIIKKFFLVSIIELGTFEINLRYFTSDYRKEKLAAQITNLENDIETNRYATYIFSEYRKFYQRELDFQSKKLKEIAPKIKENESIEEYIKRVFPNTLEINFEATNITPIIKTRKK